MSHFMAFCRTAERDGAIAFGGDAKRLTPRHTNAQCIGRLEQRRERHADADTAGRQIGVERHRRRFDVEETKAKPCGSGLFEVHT